jgi:hypothetical protein
MKKRLLLLSFVLIAGMSIAQTTNNEKRLSEIEAEIKSAAASENYELAAKLKNEQKLRLEIKEAIAIQDFDKAERLKNELNGNTTTEEPIEKTTTGEQTVIETEGGGTNNSTNEKSNNIGKLNNKRAVNILFGPLGASVINGNPIYTLGFKFRHKFYINHKSSSKWKFGIEAEWINLLAHADFSNEITLFQVSFLKPGFASTYYINEKLGVDAGVNFGPNILINATDGFEVVDAGIDVNLHAEFFVKNFAVGINYQILNGFQSSSIINHFGIYLGWRISKK